jgi:predicted amidophosphoribosyltransferase
VWVPLLIVFAMAGCGAWLANRRGRSAVGWFLIVLFLHVIGLGILLALPRLRLTCPLCTGPYTRGATVCESCGAPLPPEGVVDRLTPGQRYDSRCPACETPYREDDYQPDAEHIFCSACREELPRRRTSPDESTAPSTA